MANKLKGEVDLKVGENDYVVCFDHEALIELEDLLDRGIIAISNEMSSWQKEPDRIRLKWVRALLFVGLKKHQPRMRIEDVNDILAAASGTPAIMNAIGDALAASFGSRDEVEDRPT